MGRAEQLSSIIRPNSARSNQQNSTLTTLQPVRYESEEITKIDVTPSLVTSIGSLYIIENEPSTQIIDTLSKKNYLKFFLVFSSFV